MSEALDYYEILGAPRSSTVEELKKAYKKMALVWHPDRHSNDSDKVRKEAEEQFKLVSEANDVLQDPQKKAIFDRYGCYPAHRLFRPERQQTASSAGTSQGAAYFPRTAPAPKTRSSFYQQETHENTANPRGSSFTPYSTYSSDRSWQQPTTPSPSSTPSSSPPYSTYSSDRSWQQPDNRTSSGGFAERAARGDGGTGGDGGRSRDPTTEESVRRAREREVKLAVVAEAMERERRKERDGPAHTHTHSAATRPMGGFTPNESPAAYTPPTTTERERERERERESLVQSSRKPAGRKPEGIIRRLEFSLEELFTGCKKSIEYQRRIVDGVSQKTMPLSETLIVEVPMGRFVSASPDYAASLPLLPTMLPELKHATALTARTEVYIWQMSSLKIQEASTRTYIKRR
jgi:curved DNA-binding protein CbpA